MSYFLAPALKTLTSELDGPKFPTVAISDGWIGDPSHAARKSDHNPCWYCTGRLNGVVRAVDIGIAGRDAKAILRAVIGDPRVWYVIHKGVIYSRTYGWAPRRYIGHPHDKHIHVSLRHGVGEFDTSRWLDPKVPARKTKPLGVQLKHVHEQFQAARTGERVEFLPGVKRVQRALNRVYGFDLATDGIAGPKTLDAWGHHEARSGRSGRPRIPDEQTLTALAKKSQGFIRAIA